MRSTWPADRIVRLLAIAGLEAGWLTLLYLAIQWLAHTEQQYLGIGELGVAVIGGVFLARQLRGGSRAAYALLLGATAVLVGGIGVWLAAAPATSNTELVAAARANPGGILLGVAVLRGSTHADLDQSAGRAERLLDAGLIGLVLFWVFAGASGLAGSESFSATAYAATLTIVTAALLSLGLSRLSELRVEGADRAARWRWVVLLVAVSGMVLLIGAPLASVLGVPVSAALVGVAGPLTPVLLVIVAVIGIPLGLLAELLHLLLPWGSGAAFPDLGPAASPGFGQEQAGQAVTSPSGIDWMLWPLLLGLAVLLLIWIGGYLRRPIITDELNLDEEVREGEPIGEIFANRLPHVRIPWRRPRRVVPRTAEEAYPLALPLLVGRPEERRLGETPRDHARRVAPTALGRAVGRLAADYQLVAFAERSLTAAEERRALARWRRVERASRMAPPRVEDGGPPG
jgi:hypothetical protein